MINCNNCTFSNFENSMYCSMCGNDLSNNLNQSANNSEMEFIQITNTNQFIAKKYLTMSNNDLDKAVNLYYQFNDNNIIINNFNNSSIINQNFITSRTPLTNSNFIENFLEEIMNNIDTIEEKQEDELQLPEDNYQLTGQLLYRYGTNKFHHCLRCDSKAFIRCIKILNFEECRDVINMIPEELLNILSITPAKYEDLKLEIVDKIKKEYLPMIIHHIIKGTLKDVYYNREILAKKYDYNKFIELMELRHSRNYRIIWETLHQNNYEKSYSECELKIGLNKLMIEQEFISYINQSWNDPIYNHPISEKIMESLKKEKLILNSSIFEKLKNENCAICQDNFGNCSDERDIINLGCHTFCSKCIEPWLKKYNNICPVCRKKIE